MEKERGYEEAQRQFTTYLSNNVWIPCHGNCSESDWPQSTL